jgi:3-dehydroquinate dehydratase II
MHGVNLDQIGRRDPHHYGGLSFDTLERQIGEYAAELDLQARFFHSNHEGEFVERLHRLDGMVDAIIVNAGAWTHYSWAIRDALEFSGLPAVEVHLSDVMKREPWRHVTVFAGLTIDTISGRGPEGYRDALQRIKEELA